MKSLDTRLLGALPALVLMWDITNPAFGDQRDLLRARAAAAIAIHNASVKPDAPTPPVKSAPQVTQRMVVTMYTATWCAPCQRAKAELIGGKLPFDVQYQDVSRGGQPGWCESIPAFAWIVNGQTRYVLGFPGVPQLVDAWARTVKK